jgi:two-component system sensor histidine kinase UhpB
LNNTIKHAHASRIDIRMACEDGLLRLAVEDDGTGFDPHQEFPGHLGLQSMRERMEGLGGQLSIESAPEAGTRVVASIAIA